MWKLLRYDIQAGFYLNRWKWISVIFIFSLITILYSRLNPNITSSDFIYNFFRGAIRTDYNIEIPYMFLLLQIYCIFLIGHFVYDDYMTFGIYVITKAGTKTKWLFSKICWTCFNITLFYILIFLIFISITGFKIEWGIFTNLN
ncbi:hypothetical protein, partial [Bacillus sp. S74]|uniref:hypothetical protein n=1 Tax=Bacillus sp. S74 TaxID=1317225 RepID=UPI001F390611